MQRAAPFAGIVMQRYCRPDAQKRTPIKAKSRIIYLPSAANEVALRTAPSALPMPTPRVTNVNPRCIRPVENMHYSEKERGRLWGTKACEWVLGQNLKQAQLQHLKTCQPTHIETARSVRLSTRGGRRGATIPLPYSANTKLDTNHA